MIVNVTFKQFSFSMNDDLIDQYVINRPHIGVGWIWTIGFRTVRFVQKVVLFNPVL